MSGSLPQQIKRTPPVIVADAEKPPAALGAFIAQELEHWGFRVTAIGHTAKLSVVCPDSPAAVGFVIHIDRDHGV